MTTQLNILTLNCWGIPVISKNRSNRMNAIAKELADASYDFVCLQEVWAEKDYLLIKEKSSSALPYSHYFHSGVMGSGLCILSKHRIESAFFHGWPLNGYAHKIQHGDWFGGKGIALCTFSVSGLKVNVYNVHMHAEYSYEGPNKYLAHRISQAFDTAQFIYVTSAYADMVLLAGDLNTEPGDLCYKILEQHADLMDTFCVASLVDNDGGMGTNDCIRNSYSCSKSVRGCPQGKRIDHIMYRVNGGHEVKVSSYSLPLPKRVDGHNFSYSDHEAVTVSLAVSLPSSGESGATPFHPKSKKSEEMATLEEARLLLYKELSVLRADRRTYAMASAFLIIFLVASFGGFSQTGTFFYIAIMVLRNIAVLLLVFTIFMATVWNSLEKNALLATHEALKVVISSDAIDEAVTP